MRITVDVKPGSSRELVEELSENHFLVYLKEPAKKGKANKALVKILKKHLGKQVVFVSGFTSSRKLLDVVE